MLNLTPSIAITHNYVGEHNLLQGRASSTRANSTPRHCLRAAVCSSLCSSTCPRRLYAGTVVCMRALCRALEVRGQALIPGVCVRAAPVLDYLRDRPQCISGVPPPRRSELYTKFSEALQRYSRPLSRFTPSPP